MRILALPFNAQEASEVEAEYTGVVGGLLVQNQDVVKESPADWQVVTKRQPTETEATALEFAWKAIKYVKSNGIIVTNDHMTLGVGPGQTNRVASVRLAIDQAKDRLNGRSLLQMPSSHFRITWKKSPKQELRPSSSPVALSVTKNPSKQRINTA